MPYSLRPMNRSAADIARQNRYLSDDDTEWTLYSLLKPVVDELPVSDGSFSRGFWWSVGKRGAHRDISLWGPAGSLALPTDLTICSASDSSLTAMGALQSQEPYVAALEAMLKERECWAYCLAGTGRVPDSCGACQGQHSMCVDVQLFESDPTQVRVCSVACFHAMHRAVVDAFRAAFHSWLDTGTRRVRDTATKKALTKALLEGMPLPAAPPVARDVGLSVASFCGFKAAGLLQFLRDNGMPPSLESTVMDTASLFFDPKFTEHPTLLAYILEHGAGGLCFPCVEGL